MRDALLTRLEELSEGIDKLQAELVLRKIPSSIVGAMGTDLIIAKRNAQMAKTLIDKNPIDGIYYFSRACVLIGTAQGRLQGYAMSQKQE